MLFRSNSPTNFGVLSLESGTYLLYECIFNNNQNFLFYVYSGSLTLNFGFINHDNSKITTNTRTAPIFSPSIITITNHYIHSNYFTYFCLGTINNYISNSYKKNIYISFLFNFFIY